MNQMRSVVAKLYSLSLYGDQTKTASEVTQVKSQLISFLKKANELSRQDIKHLQRVVDTYEEMFFQIMFLVTSGVDFDDLTRRQFNFLLALDNDPKNYIRAMSNFGILDRLFTGTGINDQNERMKESIKLYKASRRKFSLKSLVKGLDRSQLSVGGMPVQEFLVNTVLDVITGDVHAQTGDDYLKSLGLVAIRKIKGRTSLLARELISASNSYEKRASLTKEEEGTKFGNWTTLSAKIVGRFQFIKNTIKDFTISRMREESGVSVPTHLDQENWDRIYDSITELNLGEGTATEFLDEYRNRGLDSKKLREVASHLLSLLDSGSLQDKHVPMIMGVAFTKEISDSPAKGAELIRFALDNIEKVSTQPRVQSEMRTVAYQRLYQLGRLTKRELGFLNTTSLTGEVESHALKVELRKRLKLNSLDDLFTAFKDKGNRVIKNDDGDFVLVNEDNQPFFNFEDDFSDYLSKATRILKSMPASISDKAGIGAYKLVEELVSFLDLIKRHTELALERTPKVLFDTVDKKLKNPELLKEYRALSADDVVVSLGSSSNLNMDLGLLLLEKEECEEIIAQKTISEHPLSSLTSEEYMPAATEGQGGASQFAGNVTNTDMNRFSQLRRALLQSDQYKDDMKELEGIRIYIQKISQALSASITFPYQKSGKLFKVKKAAQNLDAIKAFLGDLGDDIQRINRPRIPKFITDIVGNTERLDIGVLDAKGLDGFFEAIQKATDLYDEIKDVEASNLPSDFEAKVNEALNDVISEYNKFSGEFPQNYRDAVGVIVESAPDGQFNDAYKRIQSQIVRDVMINELAPRSRAGSPKFPSQKRAQRARTLGKKINMNTTSIIEQVMGVDKQGPVLDEAKIAKAISDAKKKWNTATGDFEVGVANEIERRLEEGDFLVSEARLAKAIASLKKGEQTKVTRAFTKLRDAIAADVLTDYAERERLRAKLNIDGKIDELSQELEELKSNLTAKRRKTDAERQTLADINAGNHKLQERIGSLSQGRKRAGSNAAREARERRNENYQTPYSIKVDEIIRETDLDVIQKKSKVREAEDRLRKQTQKMNENMASLPSIGGSNKSVRVLSDITMASILANRDIRQKVGEALVSADLDKVIDFVFGVSLSDCFPTLSDTPSSVIERFKGFMNAFGLTRRFFDTKSGTVYSPNIDNIFGDASASSIADYAGDFLKFLQIALSKELMEYVYKNSLDSEADEEGDFGVTTSTGQFEIYEALGIDREVIDRIYEIANPTDDEGERQMGITPEVSNALKQLRDELRNYVLNIGDYVPSDSLETAVKISNKPSEGSPLTLSDLSLGAKKGKSNKPREDLIQVTKSFIHGTMLLGGLYVKQADDDLVLSLGIDPSCLEDFAKEVGLKEKDQEES